MMIGVGGGYTFTHHWKIITKFDIFPQLNGKSHLKKSPHFVTILFSILYVYKYIYYIYIFFMFAFS